MVMQCIFSHQTLHVRIDNESVLNRRLFSPDVRSSLHVATYKSALSYGGLFSSQLLAQSA